MSDYSSSGKTRPLPLAGVRVLALENFLSAPLATMWLGDAGAEVIKIEQPGKGDQSRNTAPQRPDENGRQQGFSFLRTNRNKRSVTLDLKSPEGRQVFKQLAQKADIVVENLRPGVMKNLGLGWTDLKEINPRIIYVAVSGFGQPDIRASPYRDMPAFDIVAQALSGLMMRAERTGDKPVYVGFSLSDIQSGIVAADGAVLALLQRGITGEGQLVDVAMYDSSLVFNELAVSFFSAFGTKPGPGVAAVTAPFGSYKATDGFIVIAVLGDDIWKRFCSVIGQPQLVLEERFRDGVTRYANRTELDGYITLWLASRTRAQAVQALSSEGVPAALVNDVDDILECPHVAARELLVALHDPVWGEVRMPGNPLVMSGVPDVPLVHPPRLGQHTQEVLGEWLGLDAAQVQALRTRKVV